MKTVVEGAFHFYNRIDERYYDLTSCQFESPPKYLHLESSREEAMTDTSTKQVEYLQKMLLSCLADHNNVAMPKNE